MKKTTADKTIRRFDGALAWSQLNRVTQEAIGAIALELVVNWRSRENNQGLGSDRRLQRAADAADRLLLSHFEHVATTAMIHRNVLPVGPSIPSLVGDVCEGCGCTELDACAPHGAAIGCSWVRPHLCSACEEAPADAPHGAMAGKPAEQPKAVA